MFFVGMFRSWCVYSAVSWSQEAKDEEKKTGNDKGINDSGVDGVLLNL
jgi:hypothetical protein